MSPMTVDMQQIIPQTKYTCIAYRTGLLANNQIHTKPFNGFRGQPSVAMASFIEIHSLPPRVRWNAVSRMSSCLFINLRANIGRQVWSITQFHPGPNAPAGVLWSLRWVIAYLLGVCICIIRVNTCVTRVKCELRKRRTRLCRVYRADCVS